VSDICYGIGLPKRFFLRQGWERLWPAGQDAFFVPAAEASPLRQEDSGAGYTKTGFAQGPLERTARSRHRASDVREAPK